MAIERGDVIPAGRPATHQQVSRLAGLARALTTVATLEELVETAAEHIRAGLDTSTVSLSRVEPGTGTLRTLINVGDLGPTEERRPENETYSLQNFLRLRGVVNDQQGWRVSIHDDEADPSEVALLRELGKEAAVAVPIRVNNAVWGELYASYRTAEDAFDPDGELYFDAYVALLESALARVLHIESLQRLAYKDCLTGLANRRAIDEAADKAFEGLVRRDLARLHVIAADLNGLKQVNDSLGHSAGDGLIVSVASAIQNCFDALPGSLAARVGGDEFMVLVPSHSIDSVAACAHDASAAVADLPIGNGISCGIATATDPESDGPVVRLFQRADAAQYRSKRSQQRVVIDFGEPAGRSA
jgi:diguanylate cyclase (GGDEF)-like protein